MEEGLSTYRKSLEIHRLCAVSLPISSTDVG